MNIEEIYFKPKKIKESSALIVWGISLSLN